ncbi:hypothetical protein [Mycolicibacter minnesotensis]|nr:hypothetical protein [Mycolicibacter minnesotensis]BBY33362.1 hypothetical protein MMIN_14230 [Mycolicibacter minnesotensis]
MSDYNGILTPEVEQLLADLPDDEWMALIARVRPPEPAMQGGHR